MATKFVYVCDFCKTTFNVDAVQGMLCIPRIMLYHNEESPDELVKDALHFCTTGCLREWVDDADGLCKLRDGGG